MPTVDNSFMISITTNIGCILPVMVLFVFGRSISWSHDVRRKSVLLVGSLIFSIYLIEVLLTVVDINLSRPNNSQLAQKGGVDFDTRTKMEVIQDLASMGQDAVPNVFPKQFIHRNEFTVDGENVFPLGGISRKTTVLGNESGEYIIYESDEHGFNNDLGLYREGGVDIALIGDSFGEGHAVLRSENIAGRLSRLGNKTLNLSKTGNGPLLEFATLKEYVQVIKPRIVIWLYTEMNDLDELRAEQNNVRIARYINEDYSQGLIAKQRLIDKALTRFVENERIIEIQRSWFERLPPLMFFGKLTTLRLRLGLIRRLAPPPLFRVVLDQADELVESWGGRLYFVYLPQWRRFGTGQRIDEELFRNRGQVLSIVNELDIPMIDIYEVFDSHSDPLSLFPFRANNHYNAEGYEIVARAIDRQLRGRVGEAP